MIKGKIATHETFELHELLTFKNVCATKASAMVSLVKDEELTSILQHDLTTSQDQIQELKDLIKSSGLWNETSDFDKH